MATTTATTQQFVPIRDIRDGVVILKNGQMNMVLLASSINFALKAVEEQRAILQQFQSFLNTIDFSLQIYIQSRRLNIEPYLAILRDRESHQDNDLMRIQLREYIGFISTFMDEVDVMSKNFFVVIPFTPASVDLKKGISSLLGNNKKNPDVLRDGKFEENRIQLEQRVSVVEQGLNRIGVRTAVLKNDDLVELYYHIFNPTETTRSAPTQQ